MIITWSHNISFWATYIEDSCYGTRWYTCWIDIKLTTGRDVAWWDTVYVFGNSALRFRKSKHNRSVWNCIECTQYDKGGPEAHSVFLSNQSLQRLWLTWSYKFKYKQTLNLWVRSRIWAQTGARRLGFGQPTIAPWPRNGEAEGYIDTWTWFC